MKNSKTLFVAVVVALFATGCVQPVQPTQAQAQSTQPVYSSPQEPVYEDASPIIYEEPNTATSSNSGVVYSQTSTDNTVITPQQTTTYPQSSVTTYPQQTTTYPQSSGTTYPQQTVPQQPTYTNPYETGGATSYPDPYANGANQSVATNYPAPSSTSSGHSGGGGIHLQVAAFKDYYAAEQFKSSLTLAPGQSAYIQRGPMNKVIVTGISSVAEANQLKNSRFPGAFIVQGGSMSSGGGHTPEPSYSPTPSSNRGGGVTYTVNDPYGTPTSGGGGYSSGSGIGVQVGAFSSRAKAQEIADMHHGQHPAVVKKIGRYYKVILTGFSSRSAARAYAGRVGGFIVSY